MFFVVVVFVACFCWVFFKINFFKSFFQKQYQSGKWLGTRSGPTFCQSRSRGYKTGGHSQLKIKRYDWRFILSLRLYSSFITSGPGLSPNSLQSYHPIRKLKSPLARSKKAVTCKLTWMEGNFTQCPWNVTFVRVCSLMPCGHLLGKGWPLGSRLWCLIMRLLVSHWYHEPGVVLDCTVSWSLPSFLLLLWLDGFLRSGSKLLH